MLKPLHDYVLIARLEEESKTAGGIIIPDNAQEKPSRGKVVAVGAGEFIDGKLNPTSVKAGDVVMFAKWAGSASEIKLDGKDYIIIKEKDILGVL
ncbi:MAG: co-chaperone GroES [Rickettsiales bacterium]|jgi:chaperonin GroES|nr:co-chaperone GroES [Rickettsiales bacterium]